VRGIGQSQLDDMVGVADDPDRLGALEKGHGWCSSRLPVAGCFPARY
jgi:hypothetical protein